MKESNSEKIQRVSTELQKNLQHPLYQNNFQKNETKQISNRVTFFWSGQKELGIRFELDLNTNLYEDNLSDKRDATFAVLGTGRYSRVYLGQIVSSSGKELKKIALKVQSDHYSFTSEQNKNSLINTLWEREYRNLRTLMEVSLPENETLEVIKIVDLFSHENNKPTQFNPLLYCNKINRFFPITSPCSEQIMHTCVEENTLTNHGAKSWKNSSSRYLYCLEDFQEHPYLYTCDPNDDGLQEDKIYRSELLYYQYFKKIRTNSIENEICFEEKENFPCYDCPFQNECYPQNQYNDEKLKEYLKDPHKEPPTVQALVPFSFHDFYAIPLELLHFQLDHFQKVLSRKDWKTYSNLSRQEELRNHRYGKVHLLDKITPFMSSARQVIYQGDQDGREALEIFWLKMSLFTQICRGVHKIHKYLKQPHLDLKPQNIYIEIPEVPNMDLPVLHDFNVKIIDLASTTPPEITLPKEGENVLWSIPNNIDQTFTSPHLENSQQLGSLVDDVQAIIYELEEMKKENDRITANLTLAVYHQGLSPEEFSKKDMFKVSKFLNLKKHFWCKKITVEDSINPTSEEMFCYQGVSLDDLREAIVNPEILKTIKFFPEIEKLIKDIHSVLIGDIMEKVF